MKKANVILVMLLLAVTLFIVTAGIAHALPTFPAGVQQSNTAVPSDSTGNCSMCHTGPSGAAGKSIPNHSDRAGLTCNTCHAAPAPAPAPAPVPAPAPAAAKAPAPAPKPAATSTKTVAASVNSVSFEMYKKSGVADVAKIGGVDYIAVKSIADLHKTLAKWNQQTKEFSLSLNELDLDIKGKLNSKTITINGVEQTMDQPVLMANNRLFLGIEAFAGALGGHYSSTYGEAFQRADFPVTPTIEVGKVSIKPYRYTSHLLDLLSNDKGKNEITGRYPDDPTAAPAGRAACARCHNAEAFKEATGPRGQYTAVDRNATAEEVLTAMTPEEISHAQFNCTTCHQGRGNGARYRGLAEIPGGEGMTDNMIIEGRGYGAFCMDCHNGRNTIPAPDSERKSYPHYSVQGSVFNGFGGMEVDGFAYGSSPHNANPDACVSCHMYQNDYGYANHSFKIEANNGASAACGSCHNGLTTTNRPALGDFDGNGKVEGIQDEVAGLVHILEIAIEKGIDPRGGSIHTSHGQFEFLDADGKVVSVDPIVYKAAFNYELIHNDRSMGVHNPMYVVQLLQQSYKELTGTDVPNARIK